MVTMLTIAVVVPIAAAAIAVLLASGDSPESTTDTRSAETRRGVYP